MRYMVDRMNAELIEGTNHPYKSDMQVHCVSRYYAMQSMISGLEGHIVSIQAERDRIVEEWKERINGGSGN